MTFINLNKSFPQTFNGQIFFTNTGKNGPSGTDFPARTGRTSWSGAPQFSFGGGGVYNHNTGQNDFAVFVQDDCKATKNLTLNLGFRTEILGAWNDGACHIGNVDSV